MSLFQVGLLVFASCVMVSPVSSASAPTAASLQEAGTAWLDTHDLGGTSGHIGKVSFTPLEFYSIQSFYDYEAQEAAPANLGVYKVNRGKSDDSLVGILFDQSGRVRKYIGIVADPSESCVPYRFYELGKLELFFMATNIKNADLWALRETVLKAVLQKLRDAKLTHGHEWISTTIAPNDDQYEPDQWIYISNMMHLEEFKIAEMLKGLKVDGASYVHAVIDRSANASGPACPRL